MDCLMPFNGSADNDIARFARDHLGKDRVDQQENAVDVHRPQAVPGVRVTGRHGIGNIEPGVGQKHVDPAKRLQRFGRHPINLGGLGQIGGQHHGGGSDPVGHLLQPVARAANMCDARPSGGDGQRHRTSDARTGPGDQDGLALQISRHRQSPWLA